jgi:hypothetical protein
MQKNTVAICNPALALLGQGLKKSPIGKKLDFANHPYLCKGLIKPLKRPPSFLDLILYRIIRHAKKYSCNLQLYFLTIYTTFKSNAQKATSPLHP